MFFTRMFCNAAETEVAIHGHNDELSALTDKMVSRVIPRLLRPIETDGRSVKPCLLDGDLAVDIPTGKPFHFRFCVFLRS